ncbi:rhomboid family intramembrane serine protease [Isoalcanivorax beigongshangi]|uniref:Rhomboid family intramembrane serine protease n=1 Tax=Isoalcanivorax beigongshangi TaxID=3238810 RepID=A0ABV4ALD9_9GAMM
MIELASFPDAAVAEVFSRALGRAGYGTQVRAREQQFVLLLEDAAHYDAARQLLSELVRNPSDARLQDQAWQSGEVMPRQPRSANMPPLLGSAWWASMGPLTRAVLVACAVIYGLEVAGFSVYRTLLFAPSLEGLQAQPWRLFSPMLMHFSLLHLLFNLLWWSDLGRTIERFQSSVQLLWVTLVTAAVSNLAQFLASGPMFGGLSGVVYGLLGYLWIYGRVNPGAGYGLRREIVLFMLAWLVICYVGFADVVANEAHLAGLLSGCVLGAITGLQRRRRAA